MAITKTTISNGGVISTGTTPLSGTNTINSANLQNTMNWGHTTTTTTNWNPTTGTYYSMSPYYTSNLNTTERAIEFTEFLFKLLDIDMDFEKFSLMDDGEKAAFVRQHVIGNIIK